MGKKQNQAYTSTELLKVFLYTYEEYLQFATCFEGLQKRGVTPNDTYVFIQTKLMLIRKYETRTEQVYLRNVLNTAKLLFPKENDCFEELIADLDAIENSNFELFLSDGKKRDLHEAVEDVMYGNYLHANKDKIENMMKTNTTTYLIAVDKYVKLWDDLLGKTYAVIDSLATDKYVRSNLGKASVAFDGYDNTQGQDIHSVPYWSNLRGKDISHDEAREMTESLSKEEMKVLNNALAFINELQKDDYSVKVLRKMVYPVTESYWGDFSSAHLMIGTSELGCSNKVRFNEAHDIAWVVLFKNFDPNGAILINQLQYSDRKILSRP